MHQAPPDDVVAAMVGAVVVVAGVGSIMAGGVGFIVGVPVIVGLMVGIYFTAAVCEEDTNVGSSSLGNSISSVNSSNASWVWSLLLSIPEPEGFTVISML
ncbi:hypothetical protein Dimus_033168 [Dionaea muscipula]